MVVLGLGLFITFKYPNAFEYSLAALLVGFLMSQIGIHFTNRWGHNPRPDEIVDKSLKGLGREFTVYHYVTPVSHLLVGPAGIWTIMPNFQGGMIAYDKKRWQAKGGGFPAILYAFVRAGKPRPPRPGIRSRDQFGQTLPENVFCPKGPRFRQVNTILLFANPKVELKVEDAPLPALTPKDLKDFLREKSKEKAIGELTLSTIRTALPQAEKDE